MTVVRGGRGSSQERLVSAWENGPEERGEAL